MKTDQKPLADALSKGAKVADSKGTMPVLADVRLSTDGGVLTIEATNLATGYTTSLSCSGDIEPVCCNARDLLDRVKAMPPAELTLKLDKQMLSIQHGKRRFRLHTRPGEEFPESPRVDSGPEYEFAAPDLLGYIGTVRHAISSDVTRQHLNSLLFRIESRVLTLAATDGRRLGVRQVKLQIPEATDCSALIPLQGVQHLTSVLDGAETATLQLSDTVVAATADGDRVWAKLTEGQFPPYEQVIPDKCARSATCNREALMGAIRAVAVSASAVTGGVVFRASDKGVTVTAESPDAGDATDTVDGTVGGEPLTFGCSARYLLDALSVLECEDVTIEGGAELDPIDAGLYADEGRVRTVRAKDILRTVSTIYGIAENRIRGSDRHKSISRARQIAMHITRNLTHMSYPEIARAFGRRDHTTAIRACKKISAVRRVDASLDAEVMHIERLLCHGPPVASTCPLEAG